MENERKDGKKKAITYIVGFLVVWSILAIFINNAFLRHEEELVYVTKTGECYHSKGCFYLKSVIEIGLETAKRSGYRACSYCHGIPNGTIIIDNYVAAFGMAFGIILIGLVIVGIFISKKEEYKENQQNKVVIKQINASNYISDDELEQD